MFRVRVFYDTPAVRDGGLTFGGFSKREDAEDCMKTIAARPDVRGAELEEYTDGDV